MVLADWASVGTHFLPHGCLLTWQREEGALWVSLIRALITFMMAKPQRPYLLTAAP